MRPSVESLEDSAAIAAGVIVAGAVIYEGSKKLIHTIEESRERKRKQHQNELRVRETIEELENRLNSSFGDYGILPPLPKRTQQDNPLLHPSQIH